MHALAAVAFGRLFRGESASVTDMGFRVDRGGGREGKKSSLRSNKKAIAEAAKSADHKPAVERPSKSLPPHPLLSLPGEPLFIDCNASLISRQFDRDREAVLRRARQEGVQAILVGCTDFEKFDALFELCSLDPQCFALVGLHPDNIKRTNDKLHSLRMEKLKDYALASDAVAVSAALDFSRDISTHYAQEKCLEAQILLAADVGLPLVVQHVSGHERLVEIVRAYRHSISRCAVFGFAGSLDELEDFVDVDCYLALSAALMASEHHAVAANIARIVPRNRIFLSSNSPYDTPSNIPDEAVRMSKNEPSNLPFLAEFLAHRFSMDTREFAALCHANSKAFFSLVDPEDLTAAAGEGAEDASLAASDSSSLVPEVQSSCRALLHPQPQQIQPQQQPMQQPMQQSPQEPLPKATSRHADARSERSTSDLERSAMAENIGCETASTTQLPAPGNASLITSYSYVCRRCRKQLFRSADVVEHSADIIRSRRALGPQRDARACDSLFISRNAWLRVCAAGATTEEEHESGNADPLADTDPHADHGSLLDMSEAKIDCPYCGSKLGRASTMLGVLCGCGAFVDPPAFKIGRARVERIVEGDISATIIASMHLSDDDADADDDDDHSNNGDSGSQKQKQRKKKAKVKKTSKGNFSSYRNKDY